MPTLNQRGVTQILLILLLLGGLIAGVWGVQYARTVLTPRASGQSPIQIVDKDKNPITETDNINVYLKITLPAGWILPESQSSSLVKQAYAQKSCPQESPFNGVSCTIHPPGTQCASDYQWCYDECCRYTGLEATPSSQTPPISSPITTKNRVIRKVELSNIDQDRRVATSVTGIEGFKIMLSKPVAWKLIPLSDNVKIKRVVELEIYSDDFIESSRFRAEVDLLPSKMSIKTDPFAPKPLATPPPNIQEYKVDIFIHKNLENSNAVAIWAKNTIDNYINQKLWQAGINKKLVINQVYVNQENTNCPTNIIGVSRARGCISNGIGVWIYKSGTKAAGVNRIGWAVPNTAQLKIEIPSPKNNNAIDSVYEDILAHEIGHMFGMPDTYEEKVLAINNKIANIQIDPYSNDLMSHKGYSFSEISKGFADRVQTVPIGITSKYYNDPARELPKRFTPIKTILKIIDDQGMPEKDVYIEVFTQSNNLDPNKSTIERGRPAFFGAIDDKGQFELGSYKKIFENDYEGYSAMLRITKGSDVRFYPITRSYLNSLYFKGQIEEALIELPFSSLLKENSKIPLSLFSKETTKTSISELDYSEEE